MGTGRLTARVVRVVVLAAVVAVLGLTGCVPVKSYVALGDSFTAGPGVLNPRLDYPGCLRSDHNYPALLAPGLRRNQPAFRDASCSGAQTKDMTAGQDVDPDPDNPPQFQRLDANTEVVTLGIGGNDIGFTEIARTCGEGGLRDPAGTPCQDHYVVGGVDTIQQRIDQAAPKVDTVLDGIRRRSPGATVFVVGYIALLPESGHCYPVIPIAPRDVPYLRRVEKNLNAMLAGQAAANGAHYVDTYTPSIGHDACKPVGVKWVEAVAPTEPGAPLHPNARGMAGIADAVRASMRAHGVPVD